MKQRRSAPRILIAHDRPEVRESLIRTLTRSFEPVSSSSGEETLENAWSSHQPDLILAGLSFRDMPGDEVCRQLAADDRTRDIPMMAIVHRDETWDESSWRELGAVDVVRVPQDLAFAPARIRAHLGSDRANIAPPYVFEHKRALVIDGDPTDRAAIVNLLARQGVSAIGAEGERAALKALSDLNRIGRRFDVIFGDRRILETEDCAFLGRVAGHPAATDAALVLMRPAGESDCFESFLGRSFVAEVTKPVQPDEVADAMVRALTERRLRSRGQDSSARTYVSSSKGPLRILVAEDNMIGRELVLRILDRLGHSAVAVGTGREALEALERETFDLVVMDVEMPDMDGLEAAEAIRERKGTAYRRIPILAVTAHAMAGDKERFLAAGMDAYLPKPITRAGLDEAIGSLLDRRNNDVA